MAYTDTHYTADNYCPIYEGERLNCEECGECYEECEEYSLSPIQRLGHRLVTPNLMQLKSDISPL